MIVRYYLISFLKKNFKKRGCFSSWKVGNENIEESYISSDIASFQKCQVNKNLNVYKVHFDKDYYFAVFSGEEEISERSTDVESFLEEKWINFSKALKKQKLSFQDTDKVYEFSFVSLEGNSIDELTSKGKKILLRSKNLSSLEEIEKLETDERIVYFYPKGVLQISVHKFLTEERLADTLLALSYKVFYQETAKAVSNYLKKEDYKKLTELRNKFLEMDTQKFYKNIIPASKIDRFYFWEKLMKSLDIERDRELILSQINMIADLKENRNDTLRNILLAFFGLTIGITGANIYEEDESLKLVMHNLAVAFTAFIPVFIFYLVFVFFRTRRAILAFLLIFVSLFFAKPYIDFYSSHFEVVKKTAVNFYNYVYNKVNLMLSENKN